MNLRSALAALRHRSSLRRRHALERATRPIVESLEARQLLSLAPVVSGASSASEGQPYTLSLSPGGSASGWLISWGDCSPESFSGTATSATHYYAALSPGQSTNYSIQAQAFDGQWFSAPPASVTVANLPPSVDISGWPGNAWTGQAVELIADVWNAGGENDALSYAWTILRDGNPYTPQGAATDQTTLAFTANDAGQYHITLTVTDAAGATGTSFAQFLILSPPVVSHTSPSGQDNQATPLLFSSNLTDGDYDYAWSVSQFGAPWPLPPGHGHPPARLHLHPPALRAV